jgi:hypothetical protein
MRNMSFALTTQQVRDKSKDVTRRLGWLYLKPGEAFQPVMKCMGLRPGEKIERIGDAVVTVSTRRELLRRMTDDQEYGRDECRREGFPHLSPAEFVTMFCATHKGCTPETELTRIQFSYGDEL